MFGNKQTLISGAGPSSPAFNASLQPTLTASRSLIKQPLANTGLTHLNGLDENSHKEIVQILAKCINQTKFLTEFSQILHVNNINSPTLSGHTDFYYPDLSYPSSHYPNELPEISKIKCVPIPNELLEQYAQVQGSFNMGLFTCISRAWLSIDNLIFFWNYEDGSDICFYDNLDDRILAAELFKPKPGTFDDGVEYGLCLATSSTVVLLSIDFIRYTKGNGAIIDEMRFSTQPIYSIASENMIVNCIKSAKSTGRIYMGAQDGCLYEFSYQHQTGWFSSQTKRINLSQSKIYSFVPSFFNFNDADSIVQIELDESRNILYTLSQNSTIQVFYLGQNGQEASRVGHLSASSLTSKVLSLVSSNDKNLVIPVVNIYPFSKTESKNINLLAITQFGLRLYFSLNPFDNFSTSQSFNDTPSTFQLVHVRTAPNIEISSANPNRGPVRSSYYNNGITLMMSPKDDLTDTIILLNKDLFLLHEHLRESKAVFDIDGPIRVVEEIVPSLSSIKSIARENEQLETIKSASSVENVPKLSSEFFDPPRRFVMITQQGCYIWNKLRPIDQLNWALMENCGPNSESVKLIFNKIYEKGEACALALAVALMHANDSNSRISEWASQAFFIYSGDPEIRKMSISNIGPAFQHNPSGYQQPNQFMQNQNPYQPYNTHMSLMGADSGMADVHADASIYGDTSIINNPMNRQLQMQYGQPQRNNFTSMSYITSPQKMSTPIVLRTKQEQFLGAQPHQPFAGFKQNVPYNQTADVKPQTQMNMPPFSTASMQPNVQQNECELVFSGKHDAIYIYLSRLLAPIWDLRFLNELNSLNTSHHDLNNPNEDPFLFATYADINVQWYLNKLNELKQFMDIHYSHLKNLHTSSILIGANLSNINLSGENILASPLTLFNHIASNAALNAAPLPQQTQTSQSTTNYGIHTTTTPTTATSAPNFVHSKLKFSTLPISLPLLTSITNNISFSKSIQHIEQRLAIEIENASMYLLKQFLDRVVEVFGLWKILDEHKFHFISSKLEKQTKIDLLNMNIKTFVQSDKSLLEQLINALLYRYIDDNASTDLLNQNLKQFCPSLHTNENAIFSKACEKLKQALNVENDNYERNRLVRDAVDLMKQIGYVANIVQICNMLFTAECYEQIFELCLSAADKRDPQNISLDFYRKGEPVEDKQGAELFNSRTECYKYMLDCLTSLLKTKRAATSRSAPINKEKLEFKINSLIQYVMETKDELAHISLFNWMIEKELENKLIELNSSYLESFLKREIREQAGNRKYYDLLWRFYDYNKDYQNAAKILIRLAEKYSDSNIMLKDRVNYLTQAIVALNSSTDPAVKDQINELNDRKDVALIQEKIYEELNKLRVYRDDVQDAMQQLDSQLYEITKLYYEFAEKFDLFQCQLAILKMSRHEDTVTIDVLWKQIIANELDKAITINMEKPNDIKSQFSENFLAIAREYVDDDERYFPLDTMIDSLEFVSLTKDFEPEWASTLLRSLSIPFHKLLQSYNRIYDRKDVKWMDNLSRLVQSIYSLTELFTRAPNATSDHDKRQFLHLVKDLIPKYQNEAIRINDESSNELINKLKTINFIIDRM